MQSEATHKRVLKLKQQLIQAQVLYERGKRNPPTISAMFRALGGPDDIADDIDREALRNNENWYRLIRATLLMRIALCTASPEDLQKVADTLFAETV